MSEFRIVTDEEEAQAAKDGRGHHARGRGPGELAEVLATGAMVYVTGASAYRGRSSAARGKKSWLRQNGYVVHSSVHGDGGYIWAEKEETQS